MKNSIVTVIVALASAVSASHHGQRDNNNYHHHHYNHSDVHRRSAESAVSCVTSVTTRLVTSTIKVPDYCNAPVPPSTTSTSTSSTISTISNPGPTTTLSSTSTRTITHDVTITRSRTSAVQSQTVTPTPTPTSTPALPTAYSTVFVTPGIYTIPRSTIVVSQPTTVSVPTTTSLTPGHNTYGGSTTDVPLPTIVTYPVPSTFTPGTYVQPDTTVTVVLPSTTYVCPVAPTSLGSTSVQPTTVVASSTVTPTPAAPITATSSSSSSSSTPPASTSTNTPSSTNSSPQAAPTGKDNAFDTYGMTYSPFTSNGNGNSECKTSSEMDADMAKIALAGFKVVRLYSASDCGALAPMGELARKYKLRLMLGVYMGNGCSGADQQVKTIAGWKQWDLVDMLVVGNEAVSSGVCDVGQLVGIVGDAKEKFEKAGYAGKVTLTEPIDTWQTNSGSLCGVVDVVGANLHAFFNAQTTSDKAGEFVQSEVAILRNICHKDVVVTESGWPSQGSANGKAVPGFFQQQQAIAALVKTVGNSTVFFSYENDTWKAPGEFGVEQYWGAINLF